MHIVTLATCHNRRDCTLAALSDLHEQLLPKNIRLTHVLVDDGSSDGTAQAVRDRYPDVQIVEGDGDLYWAGGMRHGWERGVKGRNFDYLFVYNDDVRLIKTAIADLMQSGTSLSQQHNAPHIIVGSFTSTKDGSTTYGGRNRLTWWHPFKFHKIVEPNGSLQEADTLNMNGALISRSALDRVGFLSNYFVHSGADYEYGLKVRKAGGLIRISEKHIGVCDFNPRLPEPDSLSDRLDRLFNKKRETFHQRLNYYRRHAGPLWFIFWLSPYVTVWLRHLMSLTVNRRGAENQ